MPLGPGVRYRVTKKGGKKIRLAFKGNKVIETKVLGGKAKAKKKRKRR